jgi:hypothetical protein
MKLLERFKYWKYKLSKELRQEEEREFSYMKVELDKYKFPCQDCLVKASCTFSKPCDQLEMDDEKVKDLFLKYNCCPDCGSERFHEGPSGGAATNVECGGCGHWYNMGLPMFIQRIHLPGRVSGVDQSP